MIGETSIKNIVMDITEELTEKISEKVFEDLTPKIKEVILQALREHDLEHREFPIEYDKEFTANNGNVYLVTREGKLAQKLDSGDFLIL